MTSKAPVNPLVKIRQAFRQYDLPEPGIYKAQARYQNHFYKPLHPNDLKFLKRYKHLVSYNLEAPRYWLYLTTKSGQPKAYYLNAQFHLSPNENKKEEIMIPGRHRLSPELFQETILEGQLISSTKPKPTFLISDCLVYQGQAMLNQHSLNYRLSHLDNLIKNHWEPDNLIDTYDWQLKTYVELDYLETFWSQRTELAYQSQINGLVFRPNAKSLRNFTIYLTQPHCYSFTDDTLFGNLISSNQTKAIKPVKISNQILPENRQFLVVPDPRPNKPDVYYLYKPEADPGQRKQLATITSLANSLQLREIFQTNQANLVSFHDHTGLLFDCQYRQRFRKWEPIELSC